MRHSAEDVHAATVRRSFEEINAAYERLPIHTAAQITRCPPWIYRWRARRPVTFHGLFGRIVDLFGDGKEHPWSWGDRCVPLDMIDFNARQHVHFQP